VATPGCAQALSATEAGVGATVVLAHRSFWGPELVVARRPGGQGRLSVTLAGGDSRGGLAFFGAEGERGAGYLTAQVGVEAAPGRRRGWYAELGLGGGVRLSLGRRFRRFPPWW